MWTVAWGGGGDIAHVYSILILFFRSHKLEKTFYLPVLRTISYYAKGSLYRIYLVFLAPKNKDVILV